MKLALGSVQFGLNYGVANTSGQVSNAETARILKYAQKHGVDTLDTAAAYGTSEALLGEIGVEGWDVVTKLPPKDLINENVEEWVVASIDQSRRNLRQDKLYGVLLHRPSQLLSSNGELLYRTLKKLKDDGLVLKIGVSVYDPAELDALFQNYDFDIVQSPLSIVDRRLISSGWIDKLARKDVELHVRSVFLQGLLVMNVQERPKKFDAWGRLWRDWDEWLGVVGISATEACIRFALSQKQVDKVIVGVQSQNQLAEILAISSRGGLDAPAYLEVASPDLLNPARWASLQ